MHDHKDGARPARAEVRGLLAGMFALRVLGMAIGLAAVALFGTEADAALADALHGVAEFGGPLALLLTTVTWLARWEWLADLLVPACMLLGVALVIVQLVRGGLDRAPIASAWVAAGPGLAAVVNLLAAHTTGRAARRTGDATLRFEARHQRLDALGAAIACPAVLIAWSTAPVAWLAWLRWVDELAALAIAGLMVSAAIEHLRGHQHA